MSWSYNRTGRAEAVRKDAAKALEQSAKGCENIPAEMASVRAFSLMVDAACKQAAGQAVTVEGSGSAWAEEGRLRSFSFTGKVSVIDLSE